MSDILVSVVVAVYNRENELDRCIDSLVYQTFEDYEVIFVDDYSIDNSWTILEKWKERFPEKIRIMKSESKGVAYAKNTGIKAAKGDYVLFVDSDDYIDYKTLRRLYEVAEANEYPEMVYSPINRVSGKKIQKIATLAVHESIKDYLKQNFHFLHGKLFRRDLFERFGLFPLLGIGEDVSWVFPVISHLSSIVYFNMPCYYYELSGNSVTRDVVDPQLIEDMLTGSDILVEATAPEYKEEAIRYAFSRICNLAKNRMIYKDVFNKYLLEHRALLEEIDDLKTKAPDVFQMLEALNESSNEMPQIVYVNGFQNIDTESVEERYGKVFRDCPEIVVLNEDNCDLEHCPKIVSEAFLAKNMEFVGKYFALKKCYEQGGIFIDDDVEIDAPFNMFINDPCFFGFESNDTFSDKVFGACEGNPCLKKILQTYEYSDLYEEKYAPLKERIKTVIIGSSDMALNSCTVKKTKYGFCLYSTEMFVYSLACTDYPHVSHYKEEVFAEQESVCISQSTLTALCERHVRVEVDKQNIPSLRKDRDFLKNKSNTLEGKVKTLEKEKATLKNKSTAMEGKVTSLEKDRTFLKNKSAKLEMRVGGLEKDRSFLKDKSAGLERKVDSLEKDRAYLKGKSKGLEERLEDSVANRTFLEGNIVRLETKLEGLLEDRVFLKDKSARLEKKVENLQLERGELETKLEGLLGDRTFLKNKSVRLEKKVEDLQVERDELKNKVAELETQLGEFWRSKIARVGRKLSQKVGK